MTHARSQDAFARAKLRIPGGVNSPARAFGGVGGEPLFIARAAGPHLWDLDGNRYIDYVLSWGPMILGHCHAAVTAALESALHRGTSYGAPTEAETELAERVIRAVPSIERLRLVNSGTEATMSAVRLARGFTGRPKIVKFAGNYHGHVDSLLVAAGSSAATLGVPNSPGVTAGAAADTLVLAYNDAEGLAAAFDRCGGQIAAVIVEPVAGNMGCVLPTAAFVAALSELPRRHGALLICDEVMTGFRVAHGGAQAVLGLRPDLTTLGKVIGGGLPVGAYGGRADVMDAVLPVGKVFQAGTLSGNPLAVAAGIATLKTLEETQPYAALEEATRRLAAGMEEAARAAGVPCTTAQAGAMFTLFFAADPVVDWTTASRADTRRYAAFFWQMLERGVYLPCSQYECLFLSTVHGDGEIEATLAAAREAMQAVARA